MSETKYRKYAISYIRFSTAKQALGNSYDRQFEQAKEYCDERGITIIDKYKDLGRSAYKSFNLLPGSDLAFFLKSLKNGEIANPKETYLLIESLDRLSRAYVTRSLNIFTQILEHGISIITLLDGQIYDADDDLNKQTSNFITSIMMLSKAHAESLDKSYRIGKAWQAKKNKAREQAKTGQNSVKALTKMCPFWLEVKKTKYYIKDDYATTIKFIFDLATGEYDKERHEEIFAKKIEKFNKLKANSKKPIELNLFNQSLSSNEIVKVLNTLNIPILKSGMRKKTKYWNTSNINKILTNIALTGVYQPKKLIGKERELFDDENNKYQVISQYYEADGEAIEGFYPIIINEEQFIRAQRFKTKRLKGNKGRKGKKFSNILNGLAVCRSCRSNMVHNNKGTSKSGKKWVYLQCSLARVGGDCKYESVNYEYTEYNLLRFMQGTDFSPVIGSSDQDQQQIDIQAQKVDHLQEKLSEINRQFVKYIEADYTGFEDIREQKISELQNKKKHILTLFNQEELELSFLVSNKISEKFDKSSFKRLIKEISLDNPKLSDQEIYFNRMKANTIISHLIDKLQVDTIKKKLLIIYKDGSGQVINIDTKFDDPKSSVISINIPKFLFPVDMNEESKPKFYDAIYNYCMNLLDFMHKLKANGKYSSDIREKLYYSRLNEITKYLTEMAKLNGYKFRYEKDKNTFHFE